MATDFLRFINRNRRQCFTIFALYTIVLVAIGSVNYPYIDDIIRRLDGLANFAAHYSRYLSEYASYFVQGSTRLADSGLATFLLSAVIMTTVSSCILYVLTSDEELTWSSTLASVVVGINPWFLEPLSFRFDSPYMALSLLVSVLPFLYYKKNLGTYFLVSVLGIFLMCNSYQGSSAIYIVMTLTMLYLDLQNRVSFKRVTNRLFTSVTAYGVGVVVYYLQTKLNPALALRGETTTIAPLRELPRAILTNLEVYFTTLRNQSTIIWLLLALFIVVYLIVVSAAKANANSVLSLGYSVVYIVLGTVMSYGLYMFWATPLADDRPRYAYGFAFLLGLFLILIGRQVKFSWLRAMTTGVIVITVYYALSFAFVYASTLDHQKTSFEQSSFLLANNLNDHLTVPQQTVYVSSFFKDSRVYQNTVTVYPMIKDLVPSNQSLYWPNLLWFSSLTNMDINLIGLDFSTVDRASLELLEDNYYWNIYRRNDELYVEMK